MPVPMGTSGEPQSIATPGLMRRAEAVLPCSGTVKRVHVWISGTVQGVWFRESTRLQAERWQLRGWVRNLPDGRVEAVFEGTPDGVDDVVQWCRTGPERAVVQGFESREEPTQGEDAGFRVLR